MTSTSSKLFNEPHRRMGEGERLWARVSEAGSTNGSMVLQLQGAVDADRMHRAAEALARVHPMMRAHIPKPPHRDFLVVPDTLTVPWRIIKRQDDQHWISVVEEELNNTITAHDRPLWRLCLVQGETASELIMTMHHAVSDGASGYILMTHLLQAYDGRKPLPEPQPIPAAQDTFLLKPRDWRQWGYNLRSLLKMSFRPKAFRWDPNHSPSSSPAACVTKVVSAQVEPSITEALQAVSQQQGKTLHGLVGAVYMQAAADLMGLPAGQPLTMTSAVGVRHLLPRALNRSVGYYVAGCEIESPVGEDPWPLAEAITLQTTRQMRARQVVLNIWLRKLILFLKPEGRQLVEAAPRTSRAQIHLTNMGRTKMVRESGGLHLARCFHVSSVHLAQRPFINLAAVVIDGEMQMSFSHCSPLTTASDVQRIIDGMQARFRTLAHAMQSGRMAATSLPEPAGAD